MVRYGQWFTSEGCDPHVYFPNPYRCIITKTDTDVMSGQIILTYRSYEQVDGFWNVRTEESAWVTKSAFLEDVTKGRLRLVQPQESLELIGGR